MKKQFISLPLITMIILSFTQPINALFVGYRPIGINLLRPTTLPRKFDVGALYQAIGALGTVVCAGGALYFYLTKGPESLKQDGKRFFMASWNCDANAQDEETQQAEDAKFKAAFEAQRPYQIAGHVALAAAFGYLFYSYYQ